MFFNGVSMCPLCGLPVNTIENHPLCTEIMRKDAEKREYLTQIRQEEAEYKLELKAANPWLDGFMVKYNEWAKNRDLTSGL